MSFLKEHLVFSIVVLICLLSLVVELVMIASGISAAGKTKEAYDKALGQREKIVALEPRPTAANAEAAKANVERLEQNLADKLAQISGKGDLSRGEPADSSDLFFELQDMVERFRSAASRRIQDDVTGEMRPYIKVPESFAFGFGYFIEAGKGPKPQYIHDVFIQERVLGFLLHKLYESKPMSIVSVLRDPVTLDLSTNPKVNLPKETFLIDPMASARQLGYVDTYAFKITFTGYSESLRLFLNSLDSFDYPLVVSSVEVEQAPEIKTLQQQQRDANTTLFQLFGQAQEEKDKESLQKAAEIPVVTNNLSTFTVVIELLQVVEPKS